MKRLHRKKSFVIKLTIVIFLIIFLMYYFFVVSPIIKTYTSAETQAVTEEAINRAVSNVINQSLKYDSLIDISYTASGDIASFTANQFEINSISREIVEQAQIEMQTLGDKGLNINLGTFSGMPFLIGRGPIINLKLTPIGAVSSSFESTFESVGINMTKHTLYLYINVHLNIVLPIKSYDIYTSNQVLLAESIIIGKVPEVYLNGGSLGEALNLVP